MNDGHEYLYWTKKKKKKNVNQLLEPNQTQIQIHASNSTKPDLMHPLLVSVFSPFSFQVIHWLTLIHIYNIWIKWQNLVPVSLCLRCVPFYFLPLIFTFFHSHSFHVTSSVSTNPIKSERIIQSTIKQTHTHTCISYQLNLLK